MTDTTSTDTPMAESQQAQEEQMVEITSTKDEMPWIAIPLVWFGVYLFTYLVLGLLRFTFAFFLAVFLPGEYKGWHFWNNEVAESFVNAHPMLHSQIAGHVALLALIVVIYRKLSSKKTG